MGLKGYNDQNQYMFFATALCLIPENVLRAPVKITGNGLTAGCQLFYRKIDGYFCSVLRLQAVYLYSQGQQCDKSS